MDDGECIVCELLQGLHIRYDPLTWLVMGHFSMIGNSSLQAAGLDVQGHRDVWYTLQQRILAIFNAEGFLRVAAGNVCRFTIHRLWTSHAFFAKPQNRLSICQVEGKGWTLLHLGFSTCRKRSMRTSFLETHLRFHLECKPTR
jgi:hypothetical protein